MNLKTKLNLSENDFKDRLPWLPKGQSIKLEQHLQPAHNSTPVQRMGSMTSMSGHSTCSNTETIDIKRENKDRVKVLLADFRNARSDYQKKLKVKNV